MACRRCKRAGKEDQCPHPSVNRPEWKSEDSYSKVKAIFGDRTTMLKREILGLVADDETLAFQTDHLKAFFARPPLAEPHAAVHTVYMAIDPNGGGSTEDGSETAIVSFFYQAGQVVVRFQCMCVFMTVSFCCWCRRAPRCRDGGVRPAGSRRTVRAGQSGCRAEASNRTRRPAARNHEFQWRRFEMPRKGP